MSDLVVPWIPFPCTLKGVLHLQSTQLFIFFSQPQQVTVFGPIFLLGHCPRQASAAFLVGLSTEFGMPFHGRCTVALQLFFENVCQAHPTPTDAYQNRSRLDAAFVGFFRSDAFARASCGLQQLRLPAGSQGRCHVDHVGATWTCATRRSHVHEEFAVGVVGRQRICTAPGPRGRQQKEHLCVLHVPFDHLVRDAARHGRTPRPQHPWQLHGQPSAAKFASPCGHFRRELCFCDVPSVVCHRFLRRRTRRCVHGVLFDASFHRHPIHGHVV
mmetsp:Transcript_9831/g.59865  ORF Transcript_9831/g.59865 Transcript_9831/m.59865 type:complete len:271 (-) Transcript_9831:10-822(-)